MFRIALRAGTACGGMVGVHWCGMSIYDKVTGRHEQKVHPDGSVASVSVKSQVEQQLQLEYRDENGEERVSVVNAHKYRAAVVRSALALEEARQKLRESGEVLLREELESTFGQVRERAPRFADWYFGYTTGYVLIAKAAASATSHMVSLSRTRPVEELVAADLRRYLQNQWELIVLRPEITDAMLQRGWALVVSAAHREYLELLNTQEEELRKFVAQHTSHTVAPGSADVHLSLDWAAQMNKANSISASFEKSPVQSIALVGGGCLAGKAAAATTGKAATPLLAKLSTPFVGKGVAAAGSAGAGAGVGAVAGPMGVFVGAGLGVGLDVAINKVGEVMQRDDFERECHDAIMATRIQWEGVAREELGRTIDVWVGDAINLLPMKDPGGASLLGWMARGA